MLHDINQSGMEKNQEASTNYLDTYHIETIISRYVSNRNVSVVPLSGRLQTVLSDAFQYSLCLGIFDLNILEYITYLELLMVISMIILVSINMKQQENCM